ncbi:MAG: hypothetical protein Fur006_26010 [Coleofasciculaceae cyanobacterium]
MGVVGGESEVEFMVSPMKIEFRSQESVIFILGGGDSAMTPVVKIGVMSAQHRYHGYRDKYE